MMFYTDRDMFRQIIVESFIHLSKFENKQLTRPSERKLDLLEAFSYEIYNVSSYI